MLNFMNKNLFILMFYLKTRNNYEILIDIDDIKLFKINKKLIKKKFEDGFVYKSKRNELVKNLN